MKKYLTLILLIISTVLSANTYYVSTTGSDNNPGTMSLPFAGLQKAISVARPGDIVYVRGGTYYPRISIDWIPAEGKGFDGTPAAPIKYLNYPGEKPIFDFINCPPVGNYNTGFYLYAADYIQIKGLTIRNVKQTRNYVECLGLYAYGCTNLRCENVSVYNVDGNAFRFFGGWRYPGTPPYEFPEHATFPGDSTFFINCDAFNCCDSLPRTSQGDPFLGGAADGWKTHNEEGSYILFEGCRAWNCSDDGFDPSGEVYVEIKNCWSFENGILDGDGNGYKTGAVYDSQPMLRKITNSIAANNRAVGFMLLEYPDYLRTNARFYNNFSYKNQFGFSISNNASYPNPLVVYKNNVAYKTGVPVSQAYMFYQESNNTWNWVDGYPGYEDAFALTDNDFLSLDVSELKRERKEDGSLPDVSFGKLASGSKLIDAGTDVGLPYYGAAPDIGYSEYITGSVTPPSPVYQGSVIENATSSRIDITYNLTLVSTAPPPSAFAVRVNSTARSVNSVSVSGTKVYLTLASPVVYGDVVTVAYTKPATNPLQTAAGGQAATFSAKSVVNNVAPLSPVYVSSVIENATPGRIDMTYSLTLANIIPPASAFAVRVNSVARSVNSVSVSGTKVYLTLTSPVFYGDAVTVAYTKPAANPLQTAAGGQAASFSAQNVVNNVAPPSPAYVSSVIENATPGRIDMTYSLTLANIIPPASAFAVRVNSVARSVSSVSVSGTKVYLTLASPIVYGDAVTVAYTKPATNSLQTAAGGQAITITPQQVINNLTQSANQPPAVSISSPTKNTSFISPATITIDAIASDTDGSVTKVEFFNGTVKLGESTSQPYSYTWKNVADGTYLMTAIATDNTGSKTVSEAVTVTVLKSTGTTNQIPTVSITNPHHGKKYKKNDNIILEASATDPDGVITNVVFKSGSVTLAELSSPPYLYVWHGADTGNYVITAVATDNLGATATSQGVELSILPSSDINPDLVKIYPNPNDGQFTIEMLSEPTDQPTRVRIFNLAGKTILSDLIDPTETKKEYNLQEEVPGAYILMVSNGKNIVAAKKFVKR
jgi:uncharacterized repeat protein (TIGR02059 family)